MSNGTEAEQYLMACALVDDAKTAELLEIPEDWFQSNAHKLILRTMRQLVSQSLSADIFAICDELERTRQSEMIGGMAYLTELADSLPNLAFWDSYKNSLFNHYKISQLTKLNTNLQMQLGTGAKPAEIIEGLQANLIDLLTDHHASGLEKISKHLDSALEYIMWKQENDGAIMGLSSGMDRLDYELDGFQKGLMYAVCARPAMGKTMWSLKLANHFAKSVPVCFFSLEMTGSMLSQRLIAAEATVSGRHFKKGTMNNDQNNDVAMAVTRLHANSNLYIDESAGLTVSAIRSRLKAFQIKHGYVGAIFIDHIGLLRLPKGMSTFDGTTDIVHQLQIMAKEFNAPLIMISQLNRNCETRPDKRPQLSDIRATGAIEEDCRGVIFLYRDEYYTKELTKQPNITEVILAKNNLGETGTFYNRHDLSIGHYEELSDYSAPVDDHKTNKQGKF